MDKKDMYAAIDKAREYIDALTVNSPVNIPGEVVSDEHRFFTWDNEKRTPSAQPYLFDWSYYNGVVMEGLLDLQNAGGGGYLDYIKSYFDAMIVTDITGAHHLSRNLAGYVDCHGADCYKTAALLARLAEEDPGYMEICRELYRDLTDKKYLNSTGHIVPKEYTEKRLGGNYWHTWAKDRPPRYKVWLDGIYMLQPFLARFAAMTGDEKQLEKVDRRLDWVAENLIAPGRLYNHAGNSATDACPYHWTRAIGWYGMAMVDVMEVLPDRYLDRRREALREFADGVLRYQRREGMWPNLTDMPITETNRLEASGTAMVVYTVLKAVRKGWLPLGYQGAAIGAFKALIDLKLRDGKLCDIYLRASADGTNNYENTDFYMSDEGKGVGPFIMACSEMMYKC